MVQAVGLGREVPDGSADEWREPVSPLVALRRHWLVGLLLVLVGTAAGAAAGALAPDTYTAESRLAVGSNDLTALSVPGYAYAASELAASTARYVDNADALGGLPTAAEDGVTAVSASPIPDSNIIRLEVSADDEAAAVSGASALTDYLIQQASEVNSSSDQADLLEQYTDVAQQTAQASVTRDQTAQALERVSGLGLPGEELRAALVAREAELSVLQTQQEALGTAYENAVTSNDIGYQLVTVVEAAPSYDNATSQVQRYGLLGLVAGALVALLVAVLLERRRLTRRLEAEEAAPDPGWAVLGAHSDDGGALREGAEDDARTSGTR